MIKINNKIVEQKHFPDGTLLLKEDISQEKDVTITWLFENNEELIELYFLTKHIKKTVERKIKLKMPYIPNARQDRVKSPEDVFTLKYFAELINELNFSEVTVLDPHSYVSEALINNINIQSPEKYVKTAMEQISVNKPLLLFFPDEGAMKRYSSMFDMPYVFGIKKRDWSTGEIKGLDISGQTELIKGSTILIIDDICSRGGTFYHSANALKKLEAGDIYLYISHCENTILSGDLLNSNLIKKVFTTNSIFTGNHENVEVFDYE